MLIWAIIIVTYILVSLVAGYCLGRTAHIRDKKGH